MTTLAEFRQQYPEYNDLTDEQLADGLYRNHYSDMARDDFYRRIGFNPGHSQLVRGLQEAGQIPGQIIAAVRAPFIGEDAAMAEREALRAESDRIARERPAQIESLSSVGGPLEFMTWLGGATARAAPSMIPGIVGGVAGALLGGPVGAALGFGAGSLAPNVAESYMSIGERPSPGTTLAAGIAKSALDALPAYRIFRRALGTSEDVALQAVQRGILRTMGREVPRQMAYEGITEGAQEAIDQLADRFVRDNWNSLTSDELLRIGESAIVGGVLGGAGAAVTTPLEVGQGRRIAEERQQVEDRRQQQQREQFARQQQEARAEIPPGATREDYDEMLATARQMPPDTAAYDSRTEARIEPTAADLPGVYAPPPFEGSQQDLERLRRIVVETVPPGTTLTPESIAQYLADNQISNTPTLRTPTGQVPNPNFIDLDQVNREFGLITQQLSAEGLVEVVPSEAPGRWIVRRTGNTQSRGASFPRAARVAANLRGSETALPVGGPSPPVAPINLERSPVPLPEQIEQELIPRLEQARHLMAERDRIARESRTFPQARSQLPNLSQALEEYAPEREAVSRENVEAELEREADFARKTGEGLRAYEARRAEARRKAREAAIFPQARSVIEANAPGYSYSNPQSQVKLAETLETAVQRWTGGKADITFGIEDISDRAGYSRLSHPIAVRVARNLSDIHRRYTAIHEIGGHALRMLGKITDVEWAKITTPAGIQRMLRVIEWARNNNHPTLSALKRATILRHVLNNPSRHVYPDIGKQEAFAFYVEAALWAKDTGRSIPATGNILQRAIEHIRRIVNKLTGLYVREKEFFDKIDSGEIAGREPAPSSADATNVRFEANAPGPTPLTATLAEVEELNNAKTDDFTRLSIWNKVTTPDYIAEEHRELRPYVSQKSATERVRSEKMHDYLDLMSPLNHLSREQAANVMRLAEVADAMEEVPSTLPDGTIRLHVPDYTVLKSRLELSNPGDTIALSKEEAAAYMSSRQAFDKAFEDLKTGTLARFGLEQGKTAADLRSKAEALNQEAIAAGRTGDQEAYQIAQNESRRAFTAAGMLENLERIYHKAYVPKMRAGKAKLVIYQGKRDSAGNFFRDENGHFVPDESKELHENPLTRSVIIPVDGLTLNIAKSRADKLKRTLTAKYPAAEGWVMRVKANDMGELVSMVSPSQRGIDALETLANVFLMDKATWRKYSKENDGTTKTEFDIFLDQLGRLDAEITKRGFKAHIRKRQNFAGWVRAENAETYLANAGSAYLIRAADHYATNMGHQATKKSIQDMIKAGRPDLAKYAMRMEEYIHTPDRIVSMLKALAFHWFLGYRLSSAFINSLQPLQTTIPVYSMLAGSRRASMEVLRAQKDIAPAVLRSVPQTFKNMLRSNVPLADEMYFDWKYVQRKLPPEIYAHMRQALREGTLSNVMTHEQSGAVAPPVDNPIMRSALARIVGDKLVKPLIRGSSVFFSIAEQQNRMVSWVAAYRLNQDPNVLAKTQRMAAATAWEGQIVDAFTAARFLTERTNFMISKHNRSELMRNPVGAIAGQFTQFPVAVFQLYARILKGAGLGPKVAATFLTMGLIGAMMTAGLWGLPGMADASDMLKLISRVIGPILGFGEFNAERRTQEFFSGVIRSLGMNHTEAATAAEALVKGPWRATFGIDISRRASANIGIADMFTTDATNLIGPAGSLAVGGVRDFLGYASNAQWPLAAAALLPMVARDYVKAIEARTGIGVTSPSGNVRTPAHRANMWETTAILTGFNPASYAREAENTRDVSQGIDGAREYYRQQLADALILARVRARAGDEAGAQRARERAGEIRRNMRERSQGLPIDRRIWTADTMETVNRRVQAALRGPAETAIRRRPNAEERAARERLSYFPR